MLSLDRGGAAPVYERAPSHATYKTYSPEHNLLYWLVEKYYPALVSGYTLVPVRNSIACQEFVTHESTRRKEHSVETLRRR